MTDQPGTTNGNVRWLLRLEGLAVLALAAFAYHQTGGSWWHFAVLFLLPDLSMLGYLAGPRVGAVTYNAGHSYLLPLGLAAFLIWREPAYLPYALIWFAHIGFDRALGYGLKYASGFGYTHLGLIGKARKEA